MITKNEAGKEVERRKQDVESATRAVADARAFVAKVKSDGDGTKRERHYQIKDAEARHRHATLDESRAREALADAERVSAVAAAHEAEFDRLADIARRIVKREAALLALGTETRGRVAAELAALHADIASATALWRDVHGAVVPVLHLVTQVTPGTLSPRWGAVDPSRDDLLSVLADATRAARRGP
jgi:hypothetical protein